MRKLSTFLLLLASGTFLFGQSIPELLYYKFDGAGTSVPNLALTPPTGTATATILGGLTQGGTGICEGTMIGSGISSMTDYVNTGWATNLTGTSWTISMRTKDIIGTSTLYYIFGDGGATSFRCFTNGVAGANNWILRGPVSDLLCTGCAGAPNNMTTFVYDMVAGNTKAYLNGVLVNTVTQAAPTIASAGPFKVVGYNTNVGAPLNGFLDDFRVYNRALAPAEILEIYTGTVSNFLPADQMLCAGDSIALDFPYNGTYTWSTGESTDSIWVDSVGSYIGSIASTCANGADTVNITAAPALPMAGFAGPDDTICVGDTLMLSYVSGDPILWSTGDTTDTIWVNTPAAYEVMVTGFCGTVSDTVNVAASALVYSGFAMADTTGGCEGDTIMLSTTSPFSSYFWSTFDTSSTTWVTAGGTYTVDVTDACGSGSDTIVISAFIVGVNAAFTTSVSQMDASFTNGSTGGGTVTYLWNFGDTNTDTQANPTHTYAANGTYIVTLTVTNECGSSVMTDTVVINFIGVINNLGIELNVYPNPASDQVAVAGEFTEIQDLRMTLVSIIGQTLYAQDFQGVSGSFRQNIDLQGIAAGVYFLNVEGSAGGKHVTRLVVE